MYDLAIPPGETILEIMEDRGITKQSIANSLNVSFTELNEIFSGNAKLTHDIALKLEETFGTPASFWDNLERNYRIDLEKCKRCRYYDKDGNS